MTLQISQAMKVYDRQDTVNLKCGVDWFIEIKRFESAIKALSKAQADARTKGVVTEKKTMSTSSMALISPLTAAMEERSPWLLGSMEADAKFFVDNILVGWEGLKDDYDIEIPFSKDAAMQIFCEQGEPGQQLYRELLASSLDSSLFVTSIEKQTEEDSKN